MDEIGVFFLGVLLLVVSVSSIAIVFGHKDKETFVKAGYVQQEYCSQVSTKWVK